MRLFVALELPAVVKEEIRRALEGLSRRLPPARWVRPELWHLTLRFLGETDRGRVEELDGALREGFAAGSALSLRMRGAGCFPPRRSPRVLWLGVDGPESLQRLHGRVSEATERTLGLAPERRTFRPHVTVARARGDWPEAARKTWSGAVDGFESSTFTVREGVLVESRLGSGGVRYRRVAAYPMDAPDE